MKYKKIKYYDIIVYYQTNFQKLIIDYLLKNKFSNKNILEIDVRNKKLKINDYENYFFINSIRTISKSKKSINYIKAQKLSCNILIGSHITGTPPLLFTKLFNYKRLYLIDDGTASFFIKDIIKPNKLRTRIQNILILLKILIFNKIKINNRIKLFNKINKYYHIYNLDYKFNFPLERINPFINEKNTENNYTAFVGQPLVDYNMVKKKEYINILTEITKKEEKLFYYCHPSENWYKNYNILNIEFIKNNISLEEYFINNGYPRKLIGITSSTLLNSKLANNKLNVFYIKIKTNNHIINKLFDILNDNGIKEYKLN